jgi:hypothetical protein
MGVLNDLPVVPLESRCNCHDSRIISGCENEARLSASAALTGTTLDFGILYLPLV